MTAASVRQLVGRGRRRSLPQELAIASWAVAGLFIVALLRPSSLGEKIV